jgi:lipid-A-disaccharide synthase
MRSIMFIAGEASGDAHSAALIRALRSRSPDLCVFGAGGPQMKAAGMELLVDLTAHAIVGLVEVLKNLARLRQIFRQLVREAETRRPDAVVLVDYPGFNLRFAAAMKKRRIKVIYYISPQVWAWHASRARQIERNVDLMLVIFPFEKDWYAKRAPSLRVEFVGHPFSDTILQNPKSETRDPKLVLLLPGSRDREVAHIFPILGKVVDRFPSDVRFVAAAVNEQTAAMIRHPRVSVEVGTAHRLMQQAAAAIVASGTATVECAFFNCPMVVVYHVNWITYVAGKLVVRVKWLAMPNLIAGSAIIPEFIQEAAKPEVVAAAVRELLDNPVKRQEMQRNLAGVVAGLGGAGASEQAARLILATA